ncbi:MAG: alpha/beta fold hydrolase [Rhodobiaceae bacterium]|nr:alpha/beta fold hydrolase [Rhodobiaceae bacterium]MCC0041147.1 alpha/beta fold hydrolase [Rhodobiaceae bacterium]
MTHTRRITFPGAYGADLAARLDLPPGPLRACALFAHCFTCSKESLAASRIAADLAREGYAVLRFDFTGLGGSGGDFANTDFSGNVADLIAAADYLRRHYLAPALLVGHSLGGAAVLAAAAGIPEAKAVATIGAPFDTAHVLSHMGAGLDEIEREGAAEVTLAGRPFTIRHEFVADVRAQDQGTRIAGLRKALLVMHAPLDNIVGIDNASAIFAAAKHPKSFVSLDHADHLVSRREDAAFAARVIAAWAGRYVGEMPQAEPAALPAPETVSVTETENGRFQQVVRVGGHAFLADEPAGVGGDDTGPAPYDLLAAALGACTVMTLRMYADLKKLDLGRISVTVTHGKVHAADCADCAGEITARGGRIDRFERIIAIEGGVPEGLRDKVLEIAGKCPVHRTLESGAAVVTRHADPQA